MDNTNELSTPVGDPQIVSTPVDPPANETPDQKYQRLYGTPTPQAQDPNAAVLGTLQALRDEISSLKAQIPASVASPAPSTPVATKLEWVKKIQEGDFDGAQQSLQNSVEIAIQPRIEAARQQAYQDALSASQVNLEMDRFLQATRQANPDILPFEKYLHGPVSERLQLAQSAGRVKSTADFLREYKSAVADEVTNIRNLSLTIRGEGKNEALSRTTDVLRSTALNPQQVQSNQTPQGATPQNQQGESNDDYFSRRRADEARRRGLS